MNIEELFEKCGELKDFPMVSIEKPVRHSKLTQGRIVEINPRGVAVLFADMKWNTWFTWQDGEDKRSHYAKELTLVQ